MKNVAQEFRNAGARLAATPAAMFLAVLTVAFGFASTARHMGLYGAAAAPRSNVVLACPKTGAAHSNAAARSNSLAPKSAQSTAAAAPRSSGASGASTGSATPAAANTSVPAEKNSAGRTGGGGLTVPLPDFNAPELSRFISPL
jgi:hypothetical protein